MNNNIYPTKQIKVIPRSNKILCCYFNKTSKIQIARIENLPNFYFERVVFPRERLLFEAFSNAFLDIYTSDELGGILSDKISCTLLRID